MLYLDESGDHNLVKIDPGYPVFVLGGVIIDRAYVRNVVAPRMRQLKEHFFGDESVILHTAEIIRQQNAFAIFKDDSGLRNEFYSELNAMMRDLQYTVIACVIRKPEHLARYDDNAVDPYMYSLEVLVEQFCFEIGDVPDGGFIYAEKRGDDLDEQLDKAWNKLQRTGCDYVDSNTMNERIIDLTLRHKSLNIVGLQLADLVVSPIGRQVIGKVPQVDWNIVETKFRRSPDGNYNGYGLKILP